MLLSVATRGFHNSRRGRHRAQAGDEPLRGRGSVYYLLPGDRAKKGGWVVISMKNNWNRIFAFESALDPWRTI